MHQSIDLRNGSVLRFGDDDARQEYEQECARARAAQTSRYAVAPKQSLSLPDGRVLGAGAVVTPADFRGAQTPAWRLLESAVRGGVVLDSEGAPAPEAA
jgi:hypothetical protein